MSRNAKRRRVGPEDEDRGAHAAAARRKKAGDGFVPAGDEGVGPAPAAGLGESAAAGEEPPAKGTARRRPGQ